MMGTSTRWLVLSITGGLILLGIALFRPDFLFYQDTPASGKSTARANAKQVTRDIHLFTVEHEANHGGKEVEVYRFDPGFITVVKGEKIRLHIHGFHGKKHHFSIPSFQVNSEVAKGEVTTVEFIPDKVGTFEIICHDHLSPQHEGPMIGYITVVPS
ncbi:Cupredoxin-like domain-containing protein [Laceyella sediminis]|jgi:heme/copper-type cytochrome/quinol oxidase subunit 2|uniref:Cupredoxin-like domain-containing protein n=2 Tax=Laceyella sediminis TaxID=573074 RepID=A0ABX5EQ59_9BACL|nr:Cupredoxin-like domain-containing protein [Laceyella sediminis]